jgi:hypothetical protein
VIQTVTVAAAMAVWWAAACRVGQMDMRRHRLSAMLWHWGVSAVCLLAAARSLLHPGDAVALGVALSGLLYMGATLAEWAGGPPGWTQRGDAPSTWMEWDAQR